MRVISLNANGLRSATQKGALAWLEHQSASLVCIQELKAQAQDLGPDHLSIPSMPGGVHLACALKKGYSGVALFCGRPADGVEAGFGTPEFDEEGRLIRVDYSAQTSPLPDLPGGLSVMSLYAPSGSASEERQASKFRFMSAFLPQMEAWMATHRETGREFLICGDWNIAHTEKDLKNWKSNQKNSGFLPEERAWMTTLFSDLGWVDVYRRLHPETTSESYTWWSNRGQAWANNVGWRIDYQIATPGLAARAVAASVFKDQRFSDHAPLTIDYR